MIDFSYETVYNLYTGFFGTLYLNQLTNFLKVLAITFFLLNVYTNMFNKATSNRLGKASLPFDTNKLLQSLAMVLVLAFYDKLLNLLDGILVYFDSAYSHFSPMDFVPPEEEIDDIDVDYDALSAMKRMATEFSRFMDNPSYLVVLMVEGLAWIIDAALYGVILFERFFFIGVLKILGSIAIVMAIFEKGRKYFYNWLQLYVAVYLLIIPFFLIIGFSSYIFNEIDINISQQGEVFDKIFGTSTRVILLAILIWLKLRVIKKSYEIVYKIFS